MIKCNKRYTELTMGSAKNAETWTKTEDDLLASVVQQLGHQWREVAIYFPNRIHKQCRERWLYKLAPNLKKGKWAAEED